MYNIGLLKLKTEQFHYIFIIFWLQKTLNHKDIISDINKELLFLFLQENIKNATLNTKLVYYQQKTAFSNELSITAYIHLQITLDNISQIIIELIVMC